MSNWLKRLFSKGSGAASQKAAQAAVVLQFEFPQQRYQTDDGIGFPCRVNGRRVVCEITFEALQDGFDATVDGDGFLDLFDRVRPKIIAAVERKIRGLSEIGDRVEIGTSDFPSPRG